MVAVVVVVVGGDFVALPNEAGREIGKADAPFIRCEGSSFPYRVSWCRGVIDYRALNNCSNRSNISFHPRRTLVLTLLANDGEGVSEKANNEGLYFLLMRVLIPYVCTLPYDSAIRCGAPCCAFLSIALKQQCLGSHIPLNFPGP